MENKFDVLFGAIAVATGVFFVYAAWTNFSSLGGGFACATGVSQPQIVHFTPAFTLTYSDGCPLDYQFPFFLGFTLGGILLTTGGVKTLTQVVN